MFLREGESPAEQESRERTGKRWRETQVADSRIDQQQTGTTSMCTVVPCVSQKLYRLEMGQFVSRRKKEQAAR